MTGTTLRHQQPRAVPCVQQFIPKSYMIIIGSNGGDGGGNRLISVSPSGYLRRSGIPNCAYEMGTYSRCGK